MAEWSNKIFLLGLFSLFLWKSLVRSQSTENATVITNSSSSIECNTTAESSGIILVKFMIDSPNSRFENATEDVIRYQVRNFIGTPLLLLCNSTVDNRAMAPLAIEDHEVIGFIRPSEEALCAGFACEAIYNQKNETTNLRKVMTFSLFGDDNVAGTNSIIHIYADRILTNNMKY